MQLLTSADAEERRELLHMLLTTHAGTKRMHESFNPDDPNTFTRSWFTWADSMFAEAVCDLIENGMDGMQPKCPIANCLLSLSAPERGHLGY